jgi:hypothetical protein
MGFGQMCHTHTHTHTYTHLFACVECARAHAHARLRATHTHVLQCVQHGYRLLHSWPLMNTGEIQPSVVGAAQHWACCWYRQYMYLYLRHPYVHFLWHDGFVTLVLRQTV